MQHAFGRGKVVAPPAPDAAPKEMTGIYGVYENAQLRAALSIESYNVHWGPSAELAMGGIAGVATFAEGRGRGYVEMLLRKSLEAMRDAGQTISSLYPFAWAFYRKQGWDWVGVRHGMKLPLAEIKSHPEGKKVVCYTGKEERPRLEAGYTAFAKQYHGMFTTASHKWDDKLSHSGDRTTYIYVYEPTGEYFLWRYNENGDEGHCREFIATTPDGHRALLSVLHYLGTQCRFAHVNVPADSPLWSHVHHWDLKTEARPVFMGRVVDFAAAMQKMVLPQDTPNGSLTLHLTDEQAAWNTGIWRITVEQGQLTCEPATDTTNADVTSDIQALSQAFWEPRRLTRFAMQAALL